MSEDTNPEVTTISGSGSGGSAPEPTPPHTPIKGLMLDQNTPMYKDKKFLGVVLGGILVGALVIGGIFYFSTKQNGSTLSPLAKLKNDLATQNLIQNPLTGEMVTESEAAKWLDIRPLGAMINNHPDARPHSGLAEADLVYEIVAEAGITRFLAFFLSETPEKIGPIRSTREYYLVIVKEIGDAMIMHIGWSPQALVAIESWPVRSFARGGADFWRDQARLDAGIATEHTAYVNGVELRKLGDELGWQGSSPDFIPWRFKDDVVHANNSVELCLVGECKPIVISFWYEGDFTASWDYNPTTNTYIRSMGYDEAGAPIPHVDQETGKQIEVKNLLVQFVPEVPVDGDDKGRLDYELIGSGEGIVFIDGAAVPVTWTKADRDSRTMFYNENGEEIEFNRGKFWVSVVPERNVDQVTY